MIKKVLDPAGTSLIPSPWPKLYSDEPDHSTETYDVPPVVSTFDSGGFVLEASSWWLGFLG
jgi:hypothetical protein